MLPAPAAPAEGLAAAMKMANVTVEASIATELWPLLIMHWIVHAMLKVNCAVLWPM